MNKPGLSWAKLLLGLSYTSIILHQMDEQEILMARLTALNNYMLED